MDIYKHFYAPTPLTIEEVDDLTSLSISSDSEKSRIDVEAEHFANVIKEAEIKVSIATIQGFLLLYKREPEMVQEKVAAWAEGIRGEQFPCLEEKIAIPETVDQELPEGDVQGREQNMSLAMIKFEPKEVKEKVKLRKKEGVKQGVKRQGTVLV